MNHPTSQWLESVKNATLKLQEEYKSYRGMLLTEGDLECHLFNKLLLEQSLAGYHECKGNSIYRTGNGSGLLTSFVHSQVTWFKPGRQSGFNVDLTIGDPNLLEIINIEFFEDYPHKGFAYDGPSIAVELKFIRHLSKASFCAQEDFLKMRDEFIPAIFKNIENDVYKSINFSNIAFICIVGCKNKEIFEKAKHYLGKHLSDSVKPCPENLSVCIFYQDEIIWDKEFLKHEYINYQRKIS